MTKVQGTLLDPHIDRLNYATVEEWRSDVVRVLLVQLQILGLSVGSEDQSRIARAARRSGWVGSFVECSRKPGWRLYLTVAPGPEPNLCTFMLHYEDPAQVVQLASILSRLRQMCLDVFPGEFIRLILRQPKNFDNFVILLINDLAYFREAADEE